MKHRSRPDPRRERLLDTLNLLARDMSGHTIVFHTAVADRLGLNPTDHKTLDIVVRSEPLTAGELARRMFLTTGALTGIIDRLEKAGFVKRERDGKDRRRVIVRPILEKCRREIHPLFEPMGLSFIRMHEGYTLRDLEMLREYFEKTMVFLREETTRVRSLPTKRKRA